MMQGDRLNHTKSPCRPVTHLLSDERTNFGNQKAIWEIKRTNSGNQKTFQEIKRTNFGNQKTIPEIKRTDFGNHKTIREIKRTNFGNQKIIREIKRTRHESKHIIILLILLEHRILVRSYCKLWDAMICAFAKLL